MENIDKYNRVFCEIFNVSLELLGDNFSSENVDNWDSILQLSLVTQIEDSFDIMLDPEDIIEFKSYTAGKRIAMKYGVEFL
jgi:acyl carrier protein